MILTYLTNSTTNTSRSWTDPRSNCAIHNEMPATNHLHYDTAPVRMILTYGAVTLGTV
jgi:hypothetical protein